MSMELDEHTVTNPVSTTESDAVANGSRNGNGNDVDSVSITTTPTDAPAAAAAADVVAVPSIVDQEAESEPKQASLEPVSVQIDESKVNSELQTPEYIPMTGIEKYRDYFVQDDKKQFNLEETVTRFQYLLGLTELFKHFIDFKAQKNDNFAKALEMVEQRQQHLKNKRRKTEKEEDAELLKDEPSKTTAIDDVEEFVESPGYIQEGNLRPYQIQGLNWLITLYKNNISGILADEMGLGKTLQTISFLGYLRYYQNIAGPHLIVVPKSTLDNWKREFAKWTPDVNTLVFQGDKEQRHDMIKNRIMKCDFDVLITSYEIVIREKSTLKKFDWKYIVIDEAHRIKNEESMLSQIIRMFHSRNRLLITGTPLQNNLHELWALLNFILPDIFASSESFDEWFSGGANNNNNNNGSDDGEVEKEKDESLIHQLHKVLQPFLLRRIKNDVEKTLLPKKELNVYLSMSSMQRSWYQSILEKDIDAVNGTNGKRESKTRLLNIVMQLRKCCNHPYLFEGAEPGPPFTTDEHLVYNSQKMKALDQLLLKCKKEGSRVLIFSQMSRMLDILEDYCNFREYEYCRIDGQTDHADRINAIDEYNSDGSSKFVFLLTTRAGGLGINLTTANVVVLFDSDWNPQADLQAMDRAHRIGQKKQVYVYRFITENAIEEKILERASQKLRLDQLVIQQGRQGQAQQQAQLAKQAASKDELLNMIQHGAAEVFKKQQQDTKQGNGVGDDSEDKEVFDFDSVLQNSESKTAELNAKYASLGLDDLQNFTTDESVYEWNGKNFQKKQLGSGIDIATNWAFMNPVKRERKENYNIDGYYREVLNTGGPKANSANGSNLYDGGSNGSSNIPRAPKNYTLYDHQFYPLKLYELLDLEKNNHKRLLKVHEHIEKNNKEQEAAEQELDDELELEEIKRSRPLTEEEEALKQEYLTKGFGNWTRRDFYHFIQMCCKHGRHNLDKIHQEFDPNAKTLEDVTSYAKAFWTRYYEIENFERYLQQIDQGEEKLMRLKLQKRCLQYKLLQCDSTEGLVLKYQPSLKTYTLEEDQFIILMMFKYGIDHPQLNELILHEFQKSQVFKFDYFIKSRTTIEIGRRCLNLLNNIVKEVDPILKENQNRQKKKVNKGGNNKKRSINGKKNSTGGVKKKARK